MCAFVMLVFAFVALWSVRLVCYDDTPGYQRWEPGAGWYVLAGVIVGLLFAAGLVTGAALQGQQYALAPNGALVVVALR